MMSDGATTLEYLQATIPRGGEGESLEQPLEIFQLLSLFHEMVMYHLRCNNSLLL